MRFVDSLGKDTEIYPLNPNGSPEGITGITAGDGRITIMMPHPERMIDKYLSGKDGSIFFENLLKINN
jgi:phosphoribosylformylglycinamidine synthase